MPFDLHNNLHKHVRMTIFPAVLKMEKEMPMHNQEKLLYRNSFFSKEPNFFFFFFLKFCRGTKWGTSGTKLKSYALKMYNLAMLFPVCTHMKTIMKIKIIDYLSLCSSFPGNWFSVTVLQFAFFRVSYKWNQIVCTSSFLDLFTQTKYFEIYSCHNVY